MKEEREVLLLAGSEVTEPLVQSALDEEATVDIIPEEHLDGGNDG